MMSSINIVVVVVISVFSYYKDKSRLINWINLLDCVSKWISIKLNEEGRKWVNQLVSESVSEWRCQIWSFSIAKTVKAKKPQCWYKTINLWTYWCLKFGSLEHNYDACSLLYMVTSGLQLNLLTRVSMCVSYCKKTDKVGIWVSGLAIVFFSDWIYQIWIVAIAK